MPTPSIADSHPRCRWASTDPLMQAYHDTEWGRPVTDGRELWETLMLEGFQAGLSWITILRKREAFREAFANFDPQAVAGFDEADVERLMGNPGIIRSRGKIRATIEGARIYLRMQSNGEDFSRFAWGFVGGAPVKGDGQVVAWTPLSETISKELKRRGFKFVGPTIVHAWMQAVGLVDDHAEGCFCRDAT